MAGEECLVGLPDRCEKGRGGCFRPCFECTQINVSNRCCVLCLADTLSFISKAGSQGTKNVSRPNRMVMFTFWNKYLYSKDIHPRLTIVGADITPSLLGVFMRLYEVKEFCILKLQQRIVFQGTRYETIEETPANSQTSRDPAPASAHMQVPVFLVANTQ